MFKRPSLLQSYHHVYSADPALDTGHPDFDHAKWCETGDDKFLPRKQGGPPACVFTLRPLTGKQRVYCQDRAREGVGMLAWWGVSLALESAMPMLVDDQEHKLSRVQDGSVTRVSDYDMELLMLVDDGQLVAELSGRVWSEVTARPK